MDNTDVKLNEQRRRKKRENEGLKRRENTLINKAYELGEFEGVEVALLIWKHGKYTTYKSKGYVSQQSSFREIQTAYPLPKNLLPEDIENSSSKKNERREIAKEEKPGR
ncbi:hypothetical protein BKA61DRAFT_560408 [Leptodontidium sp. MPI-SDFR-AT-0119]|nr:hypothetical protein BKA61DRAFT_560408 [Leptodontidium sp. MPI-SDFR-AT-0119]